MTCPSCGHGNAPGSQFCARCGSALTRRCLSCGEAVPATARFCPSCGTAVEEARPGGGERKLVTVLFADVTGSTALGELLDPEDLAQVMATYFEAMREEIEAEGGTVEKFIGDAVMAVFGVPTSHEDDPSRAMRAALAMMERLEEVNDRLRGESRPSLRIRIGINTGEVLANPDARPGEALVTGDAVNAAARLQTSAEPGQVLVSERTARATRGFVFAESGRHALRGKEIPVTAYVLTGRSATFSERGIPGLKAPMIGRDAELALLETIYRRTATERRTNLVTLYGDAGVGKSRLTREFLARVSESHQPPIVLRGRCLPYGEGVTYWPLAEMLKEVAGIKDTHTATEVLERLDALASGLLTAAVTTDPLRTVAALAHTVGADHPRRAEFVNMDAREVRAITGAAWRSLFTAISSDQPLIMVVEDIHWADPALLDLLQELADRVEGPLLLVCPSRPELTERRPDWGGGRRNHSSIFLDPLTKDQTDTLVGFLLEVADLPPTVRARLLERSEGNPFFLEEILRQLIDEGHIVHSGRTWKAAPGLEKVEIPDTVQGVLAARVDLLPPAEKRALQRAAVVGRVFWPGPVRRLLDGDDLEDTFDHLQDRELILSRLASSIPGEPEFIFRHVLIREVAYESLPRRERGLAHARVAEWIEETAAGRGGEVIELLAYHWGEAHQAARNDPSGEGSEEMRRKAFQTTLGASESALARAAIVKAARLAEQALATAADPVETAQALAAKGMAALTDYRGDTAWNSFKEATDILLEHAPDDRGAIALAAARAVETPTRWPGSMKQAVSEEEVNRYIEIGLAQLDPDEASPEMVRLLAARGFSVFEIGGRDAPTEERVARAREAAQRAIAIAERLGRVDLISAALDAASSIEITLGDYGAIEPVIRKRLELLAVMENPWEIGDIYAMTAWYQAYIGSYEQARETVDRALSRLAREGIAGLLLHNLAWGTYADFWLGNWDRIVGEATDLARVLLEERIDDPPYFASHQFGAAAFVHALRGDAEAEPSGRLVANMVARAESGGPSAGTAIRGWEAWLRSRRGDVEGAKEVLAWLADKLTMMPFNAAVEASILLDHRLFDDATRFLTPTRLYTEEAGIAGLPPHLDRLEGMIRLAGGDGIGGLGLLEQARSRFSGQRVPWETARTGLLIAEALLDRGETEAATRALGEAIPVLEKLGSSAEIENARRLLTRV